MSTLAELEKWLIDNCYSFNANSIGSHIAPQGIVIEEENGKFNWGYSERGRKTVLFSFDDERELVEYARKNLEADKWSSAHRR